MHCEFEEQIKTVKPLRLSFLCYRVDAHAENQTAQTANDAKISKPTKRKCNDDTENVKKQKGG